MWRRPSCRVWKQEAEWRLENLLADFSQRLFPKCELRADFLAAIQVFPHHLAVLLKDLLGKYWPDESIPEYPGHLHRNLDLDLHISLLRPSRIQSQGLMLKLCCQLIQECPCLWDDSLEL